MSWCFMSSPSLEPRCMAQSVGYKHILSDISIKACNFRSQNIPFPRQRALYSYTVARCDVKWHRATVFVAGWGWAIDSKHSPFCQASLTYLEWSNLWLLGRCWWHFTYGPLFFSAETQDRGVSRFTAPAFAGLLDFKRKRYLCTPEA